MGTYATAKEAALAYDRGVIQYKLSRSSMNYPNGLPRDDEDYEELMNPKKKRRVPGVRLDNTTGVTGVSKSGERFYARIWVDRKHKYIGTYETLKEAALAYDQAVAQHRLSS